MQDVTQVSCDNVNDHNVKCWLEMGYKIQQVIENKGTFICPPLYRFTVILTKE